MAREKIKDLGVRIISVPAVALFFTLVLNSDADPHLGFWSRFLVSNICTVTVWEANRFMVILFRSRYPEVRQTVKRLLLQMATSMVLSTILMIGLCRIIYAVTTGNEPSFQQTQVNVIAGLIATFFISMIYECFYFFSKWNQSLLEAEKLKRENIRFQFESLKSQVNPHFLFNSLNTLASLIEEEPKNAVQFVQHLSQVYRYVLATRERDLVSLTEEVQFIRSYLYLLRMRFGNNLQVDINIPQNKEQHQLPPLALQLLVENAIKHNIVAAEQPLVLRIRVDKRGHLEVENSLQKKQHVEPSSGFGLKNIIKRYQLLGRSDVEISAANDHFTVALPLLHAQSAL